VRYKLIVILSLVGLIVYSKTISADNSHAASNSSQLPPIETFLLEPIQLENVCLWVPASKTGPLINRSCRLRENLVYSCALPAGVQHTKTKSCPNDLARLLAEYTACYHEASLPLTIFNGWQWEYSYNLCQFESGGYRLPARGGSWENSWEAILTQSVGSADSQWLRIAPSGDFLDRSADNKQQSSIKVRTFSYMRTRDGYPKKRQF